MAYCSRLRNAVGEEFAPITMTSAPRAGNPRILIESPEDGELIEGILMAHPRQYLADEHVREPVSVLLQLDEPVFVPERVRFIVEDPEEHSVELDRQPAWSDDRCAATIAFIPTRPGRHLVRVEGERLHVPPLHYDVNDSVRVILPESWSDCPEQMVEQKVGLDLGEVDEKRVRAEWIDPSGRRHTLRVEKDPVSQKHRLLITPDSSGTWELFVTCDGRPVPGSPFPLDVQPPTSLPSKSPATSRRSSTMTTSSHTSGAYNLLDGADGPSADVTMWSAEPLSQNRDCCVNVRLGDREGELSALVTKHGMVVPSDVLPREERTVQQVRFRPDEPGEYKVTVFMGGEEVASSSFHLRRGLNSAAIRCTGPGLKIVPIETETWFRIHADGDADTSRLSVKLTEPNGHHQIMFFEWHEQERGALEMKWYPRMIGIYFLAVLYNGTEISRSPFKVICIDLTKVWIDTTGIQADDEYPFKVSADLTDSGASILSVRAVEKKSNAEIPCELSIVNRGSVRNCINCMFAPPNPGVYLMQLEIYGYPLPVSPLICVAKPPNKDAIRVVAPQEAPVGASIVIEIQGINKPLAIVLRVTAPHGDKVQMEDLSRNMQSGGLSCSFVAYFVGSYILTAEHEGEMITGSPQSILVYDMSRVRARLETPTVLLGEEATMIVEAENRMGIVTVLACLPSSPAIAEGDARFNEMSPWMEDQMTLSPTPHTMVIRDPDQHGIHRVSCLPMEPGLHVLHIDFDGSPVKGSPFELLCIDPARITVVSEGAASVHVNNLAWFRIDVKGAPLKFLNISVVDPNDIPMACALTQEGVAVHCEYRPTVVGDYTVQVSYAGHMLRGCPFYCHAYNVEGVRVPSWAPMGVVDHDLHFNVDCSKAGRGHLKVRVLSLADWQRFPWFNTGGLPVHLTQNSDFSALSYKVTPEEIGVHIVEIFFNGQLIPDCPLLPQIFTAEEALLWPQIPNRNYCSVNQKAEVEFNCYGVHFYSDLNYTAFIKAPSGIFVTTDVRECHEKIIIDYTPREVGRHQLEVCLDKENVFGSPFEVDVFDASAVKVYYEPLVEINEETYFEVDLSRAGRAPLDCSVFSPAGEEVSLTSPHDNHTISSDPRLRFSYRPRESGPHRLSVHFGETEVPLSPFVQQAVKEIGSQSQEEERVLAGMQPEAYGEGLIRAEVDWPAVFFVDPKSKKGELFVKVDGPNSVAKCNIEPDGMTGKYRVTYVPTVVGRYTVNVEWNNQSVSSSPFRPVVVAPGMVRCPELRFSTARPLDPLIVGRRKELICSTDGAGPGAMRAEVRGPGGAPLSVRVKPRDNGDVAVRFVPAHPGPHRLSLFWGELPLPGIPFEGEAVNEQPLDHSKVILSGRGLKEARVNEEAEFIIDGKHAGPGRPTILMKGVHTEVDVELESILEHRYKCRYVPTVVGAYLLTIWWSERQLRGSPFKVTVVAPSDASKVVCTGEGLSHGVLGEEMDCQIDTRRAGPGELTAHCSGSQKVAYCELYDHRDGTYSLKIKPQETGRHVLQIKFGGEHVHGSPFISRVSNAPDASCVRVFGPGVEHGILDNFQSRFIVETRGAGAGQLTVRVRGPRGAFRVEMERETRKDRTILCRYDPTEPGEYWINITWSGRHVPGSPFRVMLFDKREELRMFARANGLTLDEERSQWQEHL